MKQVLLTGEGPVVANVPAPLVGKRNILVQVSHSCISIGTEAAGMAAAEVPLYKRALKQPENVRLAVKMMQEQGVGRTLRRVQGLITSGQPTGYSAAGVVIDIGEDVDGFAIGDRVACAGAGIANHAEIIDVPVNLACHIPESVPLDQASTVTLGAIALQGIRRAAPTLGETVAVIGLGILGQLTVQMLKANGCRVIGIEPDPDRSTAALANGLDVALQPDVDDIVTRVAWATDGIGVDVAIITAAHAGHEIVHQAMQICRKKGRVVVVGDVGLNLRREDFYKKELDVLISSSYGPGRYDPYYEHDGQDYPLPYVRWTENRNMAAYLQLICAGKVNLASLKPTYHDLDDAAKAYQQLTHPEGRPLLAFLRYPEQRTQPCQPITVVTKKHSRTKAIHVALIGSGNFAQGMHLPNLLKLRNKFTLRWIVNRTGTTAQSIAKQYEAPYADSDYRRALEDSSVDLVMICTRHNLHANMTLQALEAGKHVFVEKPLALSTDEVDAIAKFYKTGTSPKPLLLTGYNRRFSPPIRHVKKLIAGRSGSMMISYRMNAGYLPPDHWVHGKEGGGRNIGEACHIYDLFSYLTGSAPVDIQAASLGKLPAGTRRNENFIATITYADGSVASLMYTSLGAKSHPKERMDIFFDGKTLSLDDYKLVQLGGAVSKDWRNSTPQKGQFEELIELSEAITNSDTKWPISLDDQLNTARMTLAIETLLHGVRKNEIVNDGSTL